MVEHHVPAYFAVEGAAAEVAQPELLSARFGRKRGSNPEMEPRGDLLRLSKTDAVIVNKHSAKAAHRRARTAALD